MVIVAEAQSDGRGRRGRRWDSAPGGLYLTAVLKPGSRSGLLPLLAGVAVAEAVRDLTGLKAELKWPNDVLIDGKKVAGVLVESGWSGGEVKFVLLGIGVNLTNPIPGDLMEATTLSKEVGEEIDKEELLYGLLRQLGYHLSRLESAPDEVLSSWRRLSSTMGGPVEIAVGPEEVVRGMAVDVDGDGALLVDVGGSIRRVFSGEGG